MSVHSAIETVKVLLCCALMVINLFFFSSASQAWTLPDTGQTVCYDAEGNTIVCPEAGNVLAQDGTYFGSQPHFMDNGDNTVSDLNTDLMWQQTGDDTKRIWADAETYCNGLELAEKNDWRLPKIEELRSLVNAGAFEPSCFLVFSCKNEYYWSSTPYGTMYYWYVDFNDGSVRYSSKTYQYVARCVRDVY